MLRNFLLAGAGGAVGSMARYAVMLLLPRASDASFPLATLLINLAGSLAIGLLAGCAPRINWMTHTGWVLLATGVCGGFTTFSAFALDNVKMTGSAMALLYTATSVIAGIGLCYAGYYMASANA